MILIDTLFRRKKNTTILFILCTIAFSSCIETYIENPEKTDSTDTISTSNDSTIIDIETGNSVIHEIASDYIWESPSLVNIALNSNSITVDGEGTVVNGSIVTITSAGNYNISGSLDNGQIIVNTEDSTCVRLILNQATISCSTGAPINILKSVKTVIVLADKTSNIIVDKSGANNIADLPNAAIFSMSDLSIFGDGKLAVESKNNDGIVSKDGLIIRNAIINITSAGDGIKGKDYLVVKSGTINIDAGENGMKADNKEDIAKGFISIYSGTITIATLNDGANGMDSEGTLTQAGGSINLLVNGNQSKAIKATRTVTLSGGDLQIKTTGGLALEASASGFTTSYCTAIKGKGNVLLSGCNVTITSTGKAGKGISTGGNFTIVAGTLNITTSGAGATYTNESGTTDSYNATCITSDSTTNIIGGSITLSSSGAAGKGITSNRALTIGDNNNLPILNITTTGAKILVSGTESSGGGFGGPGGGGGSSANYAMAKAIKSDAAITINNGTITISSADDGIKSEKSITINNGSVAITKSTEGMESPLITINGGVISIVASDDGFNATTGLTAGGTEQNDGSLLFINGGSISVNTTAGDGLDSNGNINITGGTTVVQGPQSAPELGMDYNGTCNISGGLLVVSGPSSGNMIQAVSTSSSQYCVKTTASSIGTNFFEVQDGSGNELFSFKPTRSAYYIVFSSPTLKNGASYSIYTGGSATGTNTNGLYSNGNYSGGSLKKNFTVSGKVTAVSF